MPGWPRFRFALGGLLLLGFVLRVVYVVGEAGADPLFAQPILDGGYYVDWAEALSHGRGGPGGGHPAEPVSAFYLAPLYPWVLSLAIRLFGVNFALIYYAQQVAMVAAIGLAALAARRLLGDRAALAVAALALFFHPLLYFPSRPLGETLALLGLCGALLAATRDEWWWEAGSGVLAGAAALARPNLLLVPLAWAALRGIEGRRRAAALILLGMLAPIVPVAARNWDASDHFVPISANAGMTFYHGNGPDAVGILGGVPGASGGISEQQTEATRLASFFSDRDLDPVEADRYWLRRGLAARAADPVGTAGLLLRRLSLLISSTELSLAYAPGLDPAPWRWLGPLPFALILGLGAAGVATGGLRGTGGGLVWSTALACAVTPVAFYVSSRYRLPLALVLTLPAGAGLAALVARSTPGRRRLIAACALVVVAAVSWAAPLGPAGPAAEATALANRAAKWFRVGHVTQARADLDHALAIDAGSVPALTVMQALLAETGRDSEFHGYLARALEVHPATPERRWMEAVLRHIARDDPDSAMRAIAAARAQGVELDPEFRARVERLRAAHLKDRVR